MAELFDEEKIEKSYYTLFQDLSSVLVKHASKEELGKKKESGLLHNPEFHTFLQYIPGIVAIIDFQAEGYVFMSDTVEGMWGYKAEEFLRLGLVKTITIFPVSQNEIIIHKIFPIMFNYMNRHALAGDVQDIRVSYNTKVTRADGTEGWYLHQLRVLHVDEQSRPQFGFKLISDIGDFKKDDAIDMVIAKKDEKGVYKNIFSKTFICEPATFSISEREKEVLILISEGKSSKQIAEELFISEHTVSNHRKNMLRKMDVKSTSAIVKKAIAHGII